MAEGDSAVENHRGTVRIAGLRPDGRLEDKDRAPVRTFHIVGRDGFDQPGAVTEGRSETDRLGRAGPARELEGAFLLVLGPDDLYDAHPQNQLTETYHSLPWRPRETVFL